MGTEDEPALTLRGRAAAAAGAAVVAAAVVNPLDVIKTRIQAQAIGAALGPQACANPLQCVSTLYERWGITEGPAVVVRRTPYAAAPAPPAGAAAGAASSAAQAAARGARGAVAETVACECASPAAGAAAGAAQPPRLPTHSMWEAGRAIASREGLPVLWRGTWASLLIAVPMVGVYMPLYDTLLARWAEPLGGTAPVAAGVAARTVACFCVAPFELLRTRLQASAGAGVSMGGAIAAFFAEHGGDAAGGGGGGAAAAAAARSGATSSSSVTTNGSRREGGRAAAGQSQAAPPSSAAPLRPFGGAGAASAPPSSRALTLAAAAALPCTAGPPTTSSSGGGSSGPAFSSSGSAAGRTAAASRALRPAAVLRAVPAMWTGFGATLVRDVPFSALYWALVEPLRHAALPANSHWAVLRRDAPPKHQGDGGSSAGVGERHLPVHHSRTEILGANMLSGFVAGGVAAALTTPFDVVKTRLQLARPGGAAGDAFGGGGGGGGPRVWAVLRGVYARDGLEGLFAGVKPRAFRAAPACAIVISAYELLKDALTPPLTR